MVVGECGAAAEGHSNDQTVRCAHRTGTARLVNKKAVAGVSCYVLAAKGDDIAVKVNAIALGEDILKINRIVIGLNPVVAPKHLDVGEIVRVGAFDINSRRGKTEAQIVKIERIGVRR